MKPLILLRRGRWFFQIPRVGARHPAIGVVDIVFIPCPPYFGCCPQIVRHLSYHLTITIDEEGVVRKGREQFEYSVWEDRIAELLRRLSTQITTEYLLVCPYPTEAGNIGGLLVVCVNEHLRSTA